MATPLILLPGLGAKACAGRIDDTVQFRFFKFLFVKFSVCFGMVKVQALVWETVVQAPYADTSFSVLASWSRLPSFNAAHL